MHTCLCTCTRVRVCACEGMETMKGATYECSQDVLLLKQVTLLSVQYNNNANSLIIIDLILVPILVT